MMQHSNIRELIEAVAKGYNDDEVQKLLNDKIPQNANLVVDANTQETLYQAKGQEHAKKTR